MPLQRNKPAPPPTPRAEAPLTQVFGPNRAPMPVGSAIRVENMTPAEREAVDKLLPKGTEVPGDMADIIAAVKAQSEREIKTMLPVSPDTPPIGDVDKSAKNVEDLTPSEQKDFLNKVLEANRQKREIEEYQAKNQGTGKGVQAALAAAAPQFGVSGEPSPIKPAPAKPNESRAAETQTPTGTTDTGTHLKNCPHCGWDLNRPDPTIPSVEEKLQILQHALGQGPRFEKAYVFAGGRAAVAFRELTSPEADMIKKQITFDIRSGAITGLGEALGTETKYRMVAAIAKFHDGRNEESFQSIIEAAEEWKGDFDPRTSTVLPIFAETMFQQVLKSEPLRTKTAELYATFARLVEKASASMDDESFLEETASQR